MLEFKHYLSYTRIPVAVHCWYPTGNNNHPFITMIKLRDPDGDVITIKDIYDQQLEILCPGETAISEIKCTLVYQNRKREVVLFFYPRKLQWEMTFLN